MKPLIRTRFGFALACVIPAVFAAATGFADDVTLSASTGAGVMYGVAREFVFGQYQNDSFVKSELDWDLKPLILARAGLALSTTGGFAASLDVRMGVPAKTGSMADSDWLNREFNGDPSQTHYSLNDCFTERALLLDAQVGWRVALTDQLTIQPFLGFGLMDFLWTARDGYFQYPPSTQTSPPYTPWSPGEARLPMSGTNIVYRQTWFLPSMGIAAKLRFGEDFTASISFAFSPIVFCNDLDNHELRKLDFYEYMRGGPLLEPKILLEWRVIDRAWLQLNVSYRHIVGLVGTTYEVATGAPATPGLVSGTAPNGAGASFDAVDASLSLTWTL
jgi:outer membrane protease